MLSSKPFIMTENKLFLYGTLRRAFNKPMFRFIENYSSYLGEATVQGRLYHILTYPGVLPSDQKGDRVLGEVYQLHQPGKVFEKLDPYEYCGPNDPEPHEYRRALTTAKLKNGAEIETWIYWYNHKIILPNRIESGDYLEFLEKA